MISFISVLRMLAAILITNSHYSGIYPIKSIAIGGLLGDVIFFAVSGFCLCNIKIGFIRWYIKRIFRIYPAVVITTGIFMMLGAFLLSGGGYNIIKRLIYPTNYHFVGSIILLYIPFYFVAKYFSRKIPIIGMITFALYMIVYCIAYDKTYYHIDVVEEPMIRFLFFESMLLGAFFRKNSDTTTDNVRYRDWIICIGIAVVYFGYKMMLDKYEMLYSYQFLNQIILLALLYYIFKCFAGINHVIESHPVFLKLSTLISAITLEIYLVQKEIIAYWEPKGFQFPINWILVSGCILIAAILLHFIVIQVNKFLGKMIDYFRKLGKNDYGNIS